MMKISTAYLCYSCEEVLNGAARGRCTACDSEDIFPLGWFDRPQEEKAQWFSLIRGKTTVSKKNTIRVLRAA
jgi:hypothetical protein